MCTHVYKLSLREAGWDELVCGEQTGKVVIYKSLFYIGMYVLIRRLHK